MPRGAEHGEPGESRRLQLELRTVADVGLVGLPNAGKSTLLARLTSAKPKIADYPFTTLTPNLGVAGGDEGRFVVADIPGLVEGANEGKGLGHRFLRHVMRCPALILVVDLSTDDPAADLAVLRSELAAHDGGLAVRPSMVLGAKADLIQDPATAAEALGPGTLTVSALTGAGIDDLAEYLGALVAGARTTQPERRPYVVLRPGRPPFTVAAEGPKRWVVAGRNVESWVRDTDMDDESEVAALQRRLRRAGVERRLRAEGAHHGDEIRIADHVFEFQPDPT